MSAPAPVPEDDAVDPASAASDAAGALPTGTDAAADAPDAAARTAPAPAGPPSGNGPVAGRAGGEAAVLADAAPERAARAAVPAPGRAGDDSAAGEPGTRISAPDRARDDADSAAGLPEALAATAGGHGADEGSPPDAPAAPGAGAGGPVAVLADTATTTEAAPAATTGAGTAGTTAEAATAPAAEDAADPVDDGRFKVRLANFEGPFDLLLQLISKHKLDVTEVALSKVTDEFMAYIRAMGPDWDLDQTTEFLVVAATLLDLKAARLLPAAEVEDEADLALLEARDLLFARLLQYRAYKQVAEIFGNRLLEESRRYPRTVGLEDHHAELLPDVVISIGAEGFARLAVKAMQPKPKPQVYVDHIHAPLVSVREQAEVVVGLLRERGRASFRELTDGVTDTLTVVARFLALLELYREKAVVLDQEDALGELVITWAGGEADARVTDEFDRTPESLEEKA
ncbi:segregation and condensation protein A [Streptomyces wuyuanensis]|uniref:segregation and condensation protein A n=1 Tax=Streptomyces wuyuanensis TaxID=1196353 RepID=UPI003414D6A8